MWRTRCSFRIAEAVYLVERMVDCLAYELGADAAELRLAEPDQGRPVPVPVQDRLGRTTPGDYERALRKALEIAGYDELRREQAAARTRGELMGIGVGFFTEAVGAGPRKHMHILGLGMNDGAALRVAPDRARRSSAISVQTQGQGHETTFAQIVAEELGDPARGHRRGPRRHRRHAVRARDLRLAFDSGERRRHRARRTQGPRPGADRRRGDARGLAR